MKKRDQKINRESGFTLFLALVISGAILVGSFAISNSVFRQLKLSSDYKESLKAFVASDNGVECALYYDYGERDAFNAEEGYDNAILCADNTINSGDPITTLPTQTVSLGGVGYGNKSMFEIIFSDGSCAVVSVVKSQGNDDYVDTVVESRGYNTCDLDVGQRVERAIRFRY